MSGWDTSSTHTWGQQDGPDETQAFAAPGASSRDFGDDFGSREFGRMAPGSPSGGYPSERSSAGPPPEFFSGYGQDQQGSGSYPQRTPGRSLHDQDAGYGQDASYGQDRGYGQEDGYGQDASYGQDGGYAQGGGYGQDWGGADQSGGWGGGGTAGRGAPWGDRGQRDDLDGGFGRQDPGQFGYGGQDYQGQDFGGQDYPGQGRTQERSPYDRGERESAARSDPALQDFFSPQNGYGPQAGDGPGYPREPRGRQDEDGWGGWDGPARPQPPRSGTGPRPAPRGQGGDDDQRGGLGTRAYVLIAAIVVVVIVVGYLGYSHLHKSSGTPSAGSTPSGSMMTSAPAAKPSSTASAMTAAYKLSTPATAGGYPVGQDPHFLATATATAGQIVTAVKSGGGGTATGMPVSAAYQLPLSQVMTFVGYQGTFTPAKISTILASLGTDPNPYSAGPNGGMLGCANTPATATATSGAVCVWATSSTLGITEFFSSTGPEALVQSQDKGAADTLKLRASVEAKA